MLAVDEAPATLLSCPPRFATAPVAGCANRLHRFERLAEVMGLSLMPWQRLVLRVGSEVDERGLPKYSTVVCTVPRQCGKSTLSMLLVLERLLMHQKQPQRCVFAAQKVQVGIDFWTGDIWERIKAAGFDKRYGIRVHRSVADPKMELSNGGHMRILAPGGRGAGHGATYGLAVIDEAWVFQDARIEGGLRPTMRTIPDSQLVIISNAGGPSSLYLRDKVDRGRAAVEHGKQTGVAYFEWSSDSDEINEPRVWREAIPAFGHTVSESKIRQEFESLPELSFRKEVLNQWVDRDSDEAISRGYWMECERKGTYPVGQIVVAVDAPPERDRATIVAADQNGSMELVWWENGTDWVPQYLADLVAQNDDVIAVIVHQTGSCSGLIPEMLALDLPVQKIGESEFHTACGDLAEACASGTVRIRPNGRWYPAIAGSVRLQRGNQWRIGRADTSCDVSALCAAAMAFSQAKRSKFKISVAPKVINLNDFV